MAISVDLLDLRDRLLDVGVVVVEEPDHLTVRLPFFCSVRVYSESGRLRFAPYFGMVPRGRATIMKAGILSAVAVASLQFGYVYPIGMAFLVVMTSSYDLVRWLVSEQAITRVQLLAALRSRGRAELGEGPAREWAETRETVSDRQTRGR